jgi:hypothetical protein
MQNAFDAFARSLQRAASDLVSLKAACGLACRTMLDDCNELAMRRRRIANGTIDYADDASHFKAVRDGS